MALLIAVAASLGVHALLLFAPEFDLPPFPEPPPLRAELKPAPAIETPLEPPPKAALTAASKGPAKHRQARAAARPPKPAPVLQAHASPLAVAAPAIDSPPSTAPAIDPPPSTAPAAAAIGPLALATPSAAAAGMPDASRLPARGTIRYRVDRGDQGFMIGQSTHDWVVVDGVYRITAVTETNGLVALFKPFRIELESRGTVTAAGLVPERFSSRREGRATGEQAEFDWQQMQVHVGQRPPQALSTGAQDLLSFPYQLGLLPDLASGTLMPVATGKKYEQYRFEVVGDEDVETPAGSFRSLHLRVGGVSPTELWLAYDRSLLPVKILHTDHKGAIFVEIATSIELSEEP
ncbi:MAG: DUF3108 domain-containing protein [Candidatus Accumulibacter meliphilus]|uniref:DUF3108 domain-containing protein n=1 Tax=Candidatus Accumulibacter meliphilus TaxID=2211374 RepID=UPI002FC3391A